MQHESPEYRNIKMRAEELDVCLQYISSAWMPAGELRVEEYRFHCLGERYGGKWSLHLAQCNRKRPDLTQAEWRSFWAALTAALAKEVRMPVRPFPRDLMLYEEHEKGQHQPCQYRHGSGQGYWPVQLVLLRSL